MDLMYTHWLIAFGAKLGGCRLLALINYSAIKIAFSRVSGCSSSDQSSWAEQALNTLDIPRPPIVIPPVLELFDQTVDGAVDSSQTVVAQVWRPIPTVQGRKSRPEDFLHSGRRFRRY